MDINMELKIKELDEFKDELSEFNAMCKLYEEELDEFKEELGEVWTKHFNLYEAGLDEFKDDLSES